MLTSKVDYQIIASICKVALMRRLSIVAEYVESAEQRDALKSLGVDYMQGYFIGKPQLLASLVADGATTGKTKSLTENMAPHPTPLPQGEGTDRARLKL
ncbi:Cyclic di-GMP phosphodiesterase YfgF [Serratia fonticola]|uniref:Cyclic di-GMP phosphodiesterase YfgF n=1 Tax=Serratia fonticola TaxID=47917 RepID=A0A4V6KP39_SERFO|nr:Cyclic di-GMP phosphodiesterase YfgF [Serratia fonticola]